MRIPREIRTSPQFRTSALSNLRFGVDRLEFVSGVVDFHLPVDAALGGIDVGGPGGGFLLQRFDVSKPSSGDALARQ